MPLNSPYVHRYEITGPRGLGGRGRPRPIMTTRRPAGSRPQAITEACNQAETMLKRPGASGVAQDPAGVSGRASSRSAAHWSECLMPSVMSY